MFAGIDAKQEKWMKALQDKGHTPVMDGGQLEMFVTDNDFHNGPGCSECGWTTCWHCNTEASIPQCSARAEGEKQFASYDPKDNGNQPS